MWVPGASQGPVQRESSNRFLGWVRGFWRRLGGRTGKRFSDVGLIMACSGPFGMSTKALLSRQGELNNHWSRGGSGFVRDFVRTWNNRCFLISIPGGWLKCQNYHRGESDLSVAKATALGLLFHQVMCRPLTKPHAGKAMCALAPWGTGPKSGRDRSGAQPKKGGRL